MKHPLENLTRDTPGIVEVWIRDLIADHEDPGSGQLAIGNSLLEVGAISPEEQPYYEVPVEYLSGYIVGLFEAYEAGGWHTLDLVYLKNQEGSVLSIFDCRRFIRNDRLN